MSWRPREQSYFVIEAGRKKERERLERETGREGRRNGGREREGKREAWERDRKGGKEEWREKEGGKERGLGGRQEGRKSEERRNGGREREGGRGDLYECYKVLCSSCFELQFAHTLYYLITTQYSSLK